MDEVLAPYQPCFYEDFKITLIGKIRKDKFFFHDLMITIMGNVIFFLLGLITGMVYFLILIKFIFGN